ncbi:hypothetical protein M430DRAFT_61553 [Amorphotheca resinae ATCC 22711]|uniref:RING-14 protein n=1 Tax=Amorphotheca resinae ATCC 22711 TaxID=857342 RepID=A0A2T3AS55_AMORE|nr:hypothetical protein M430DRAFT_61553 [Amorphotheca resinae ATCC 22711]PSS09205.1 hypothetical protein M430DRAFT_61553 [Amorphotheca resinae ATCC 22711]
MKFARQFRAELIEQGFPQHWVESAVPYGQLKKVIKKVTLELKELGLDITAFAQLAPECGQESQNIGGSDRRGSGSGAVTFQYDFDGGKREFRPKLTLFFADDLAVDAALSPDTRSFLEKRLFKQGGPKDYAENTSQDLNQEGSELPQLPNQLDRPISSEQNIPSKDGPVLRKIEIPLTFDAEFFELLQEDVTNLDSLQAGEQRAMADEIVALSNEITLLTKPSKFSKTDMYRWRELFDIYLQAGIFFSTNELDHGSRESTTAARQLDWFQGEVNRRGLVTAFKLPASRQALDRFVKINITLLRNLRFQEINQKAIGKILKKFDKRTNLGATRAFPKLIQSDPIMSETMAKAVCSQVTQDIVGITPQLDDYLCPICFTISWRPIRMKCQHIFCIRCTIVMQRERRRFCPLCRGNVIMGADEDSVDADLARFLKKYFPKETRQKQIELETAAGIEQFGIYYKHPSESRCTVM